MLKKIILFPFGGNARESLLSILAINKIKKEWQVLGFIDDSPSTWGKDCCGVKVLGGRKIISKFPDAQILAVPGSPNNYLERKEVIKKLKSSDNRFATIIHPSVTISPDSKIGYNTILMSNTVISCAVQIGNHCIILPNTVVSHDSVIEDYCCIGSNVSISSNVVIKSMCYVGSGVKIREGTRIGREVLVGLGSNVVSNIRSAVVVVGNPARVIRRIKK